MPHAPRDRDNAPHAVRAAHGWAQQTRRIIPAELLVANALVAGASDSARAIAHIGGCVDSSGSAGLRASDSSVAERAFIGELYRENAVFVSADATFADEMAENQSGMPGSGSFRNNC
jgi:hypothetical protein